MNTKRISVLTLIVIALTILSACRSGAQSEEAYIDEYAPEEPAAPGIYVDDGFAEPAEEFGFAGEPALEPESERSAPLPVPTAGVVYDTLPDADSEGAPAKAAYADRLIIKNAEVSVLVEDSDVAIDRRITVASVIPRSTIFGSGVHQEVKDVMRIEGRNTPAEHVEVGGLVLDQREVLRLRLGIQVHLDADLAQHTNRGLADRFVVDVTIIRAVQGYRETIGVTGVRHHLPGLVNVSRRHLVELLGPAVNEWRHDDIGR